MTIGKNIKELRRKHKMTQADIAKIAGVSDKTVSTWEKEIKEPRMGAIQRISEYFDIPITILINSDITKINTAPKDGNEKELIKLFSNLDDKNKSVALDLLKALEASQDK